MSINFQMAEHGPMDTLTMMKTIKSYWKKYRDWLTSRERCPHGLRGGITRHRCNECRLRQQHTKQVQWRETERRRLKANTADALALRRQEIIRTQMIRLHQLSCLVELTPRDFEKAIALLYHRLGYETHLTPASGDLGADVLARKDGKLYVIECKRFQTGKTIGRPLLQKLHSAMHVRSADAAIFVTTAQFGRNAMDFAAQWDIELVDGSRLVKLFTEAFPESEVDAHFDVMCVDCRQVLRFPLKTSLLRAKCPNGHVVYCDSREDMSFTGLKFAY
ncbi:MAG: restriction endonuclease [Gemmatimonadaceae bacterium]